MVLFTLNANWRIFFEYNEMIRTVVPILLYYYLVVVTSSTLYFIVINSHNISKIVSLFCSSMTNVLCGIMLTDGYLFIYVTIGTRKGTDGEYKDVYVPSPKS